jgi:holdfast attachment protein HfaA
MTCIKTLLRLRKFDRLAGFGLTALLLAALPQLAHAQAAGSAGQFNVPYGKTYNDFNRPYDARSRDINGNRTIINGRMLLGSQSTLSFGLGGGFFGNNTTGNGVGSFGAGGAVGNQLNVYTVGSWNTVIIDSTQINNGNQTVNLNGADHNGTSGSLANDGPFIAAPDQSTAKWQTPAFTPLPSGELNGDIKLND